MDKLCIIFRGENLRQNVNTDLNIINWNKTIFDDLKKNKYEYDIVFITYNTLILDNLICKLKPKNVELYPQQIYCPEESYKGQMYHFNKVNDFMLLHKNKYSRFIILRFDIVYNIPITLWNNWNKNGIILPSKDVSYYTTKLYNDIIFIVDNDYINIFNDAFKYALNIDNTPINKRISHHPGMPHHIGQYLELQRDPHIYLIYDAVIDGVQNHPLYKFSRMTLTNDIIYK